MKALLKNYSLYLAWAVSLLALIGSFIFSDVLKFLPCEFCWYQRIFMIPLVFVLGVGILKRDRNVFVYSVPLALIGWLISIYHNLMYFGVIPEELVPCVSGVSCTTRYVDILGMDVPQLSFVGFTVILLALIIHRRLNTNA